MRIDPFLGSFFPFFFFPQNSDQENLLLDVIRRLEVDENGKRLLKFRKPDFQLKLIYQVTWKFPDRGICKRINHHIRNSLWKEFNEAERGKAVKFM